MGADEPVLPVEDDEITTVDEWRDAIDQFLGQMYSMRMLCEIGLRGGARFKTIKEEFPSPTTMGNKKRRAEELGLIELEMRDAEEGYATHQYYVLTKVGRHVVNELRRRQILHLHTELKPLERQMKNHRNSVKENGLDMSYNPLELFSGETDE